MRDDILQAEETARRLLLNQNPAVFPIRVRKLRFPVSIAFDSIEHFCSVTNSTVETLCAGTNCLRDGGTFYYKKNGVVHPLVLYNASGPNPRRLSFTLAHEVGHILLGHKRDGDEEERLANAFAAELLMPRVLAGELLLRNQWADPAGELADWFGTSLSMTRLRLESLGGARQALPLEEALLRRYKPLLPCV